MYSNSRLPNYVFLNEAEAEKYITDYVNKQVDKLIPYWLVEVHTFGFGFNICPYKIPDLKSREGLIEI